MAPLNWDMMQGHNQSLKYWQLDLANVGDAGNMKERIELTSYILWQLWKTCNDWHFNKLERDAREIIHRAVSEWNKFQASNDTRGTRAV